MAGNAFFALVAFWLVSVVFAQSNSTTTRSSSLTSSTSRISTSTITPSATPSSSRAPTGASTFTAVITDTSGPSVVQSTTVLTVPYGNGTSTGIPTTSGANNPVRTSSGSTSSSTPSLQNAAPARETAMLHAILAPAAIAMGGYYLLS